MTKQKKTMVLMLCLVLFFTIFPLGTGCRELKKDVKITDIHQADETTVSITFEVEKAQRFLVIYHSGTMVEVTATPTEERRESGDFCDVNSYPMQIYTQLVEIEPLKNKSKEMTFVVHNTYSYMYDKEREFSDKATLTVYRELPNKDTEPPVPGNDGQIQIADVGTDSIRTKWTVATDNITAKEDLKYCVYYSTQDNMNTPDEAMKNGTVSGIARKNMTETVITGLAPGDYYLTVTVEDEAGNKAVYTKATATIPDADPPTPGAGGSLDIATTTPTSIAVKWEAATDNVTAQGDLEYLVYYSQLDNISTVVEIERNGTAVGDYAKGITDKEITGLAADKTYFVNIIVRDEAGNKAPYKKVTSSTLKPTPTPTPTPSPTPSPTPAPTPTPTPSPTPSPTPTPTPTPTPSPTPSPTPTPTPMPTPAPTSTPTPTPDTTPPEPGASGEMDQTGRTQTSIAIMWDAADDGDGTAVEDLEYLVYYSTSDNIDTVANMKNNGTAFGSYAKNITAQNVTGLTAGTTYYFNVIVKDEAGNKAAYQTYTDTTEDP